MTMLPDEVRLKLRSLCDHDIHAKSVVDAWVTADERTYEFCVDEAEAKAMLISRPEAINLLRQLADLGLGKFRVGRRGHDSRLVSRWPLKEIHHCIALESPPRMKSSLVLMPQPDTGLGREGRAHMTGHRFLLRPNLTVHIELPEDITKAEAARLAAFMQAIPF